MIETIERWMKRIGIGGTIALALTYIVFLAWTLPSHVKVRVTGTEIARHEIKKPDGGPAIKDVRFVMVESLDGSAKMFRNEDTGWGWPPYFKFDSGNIAAQAQSFVADESDPVIDVAYYGFRVPMLSTFPNILHMEIVDADHQAIPWLTIIVLFGHVVLIGAAVAVYGGIKQAREETSAP
jgi:hypothetical protein